METSSNTKTARIYFEGRKRPKIRKICRESRGGKVWYDKVHTVNCIEVEGHGGSVLAETTYPDREFGSICSFLLIHREWIEPLNEGREISYYTTTYKLLKSGGRLVLE